MDGWIDVMYFSPFAKLSWIGLAGGLQVICLTPMTYIFQSIMLYSVFTFFLLKLKIAPGAVLTADLAPSIPR